MRRSLLFLPILWAIMLILISCQKDAEKKNNNDELVSKIYSWLDKQKSPNQPNKAANVDLLKENIDFSALRFEQFTKNEQFIVIPIKENYKIKKNIDKNTPSVLLLVQDKAGNIIRGHMVQYSPENNEPMNSIPDNTFSKMYAEKEMECNGLFRFLSPTGRWLFQREYKNGKMKSFGFVKAGDNAQARTSGTCTYYFLNLYWWENGVVVAKETIYLGRFCESSCDDSINQTFCPDDAPDGSGSGGAGNGCTDININALQQEVNGAQVASQTESTSITNIDQVTKHKNPKWKILSSAFGTWYLTSEEIGIIKLIDIAENKWAWKSLTHGSITMSGSPLPTIVIEHDQGVGTPSFTPETAATSIVLYAGMKLNFSVKYRLVCPQVPYVDLFPPIYKSYAATSTFWDSKPS